MMERLTLPAMLATLVMLCGCASGSTFNSATPARGTEATQPAAAPTANGSPTPASHPSPTPTPVLAGMDVHTETFPSPDAKWMAQLTVALPLVGGISTGDNYYARLQIDRTDHAVTWVVVDRWSHFAPGYTTPRPLQWSRDGQYLYFTDAPAPDGCAVFANGEDLERVDLRNGEAKEILPKVGQVVSLSPDDKTLAYIPGGVPLRLVLRDLATGAERQTKLSDEQDAQAGSLVWSPDTQVVILTLAVHPCAPSQWRYSVLRIDTPTLALKTLIPNDRRSLRTIAWRGVAMVVLQDDAGNQWLIDAVTGGSPLP